MHRQNIESLGRQSECGSSPSPNELAVGGSARQSGLEHRETDDGSVAAHESMARKIDVHGSIKADVPGSHVVDDEG